MPYSKITSLPEKIKKSLPVQAQRIYLKAFNNSLDEYKDPERKRNKKEDAETVAHKVAWSAVKKKYKKDSEKKKWVLK